ncbi:MAG: type IV secretory system conjugative DNA transfer family protein [Lachnospiraceae bacterium]|nr:type IV secretory system conjugative DNA transfer family protein [Lachnospiraceae bacterium]
MDETRVSSMIAMFLKNAGNMEEAKAASGDKFWDQAAKALLHALAMYLLEFCPPEMHNMYEMLVLVQKGKQNENDRGGDGQTGLGRIFEKARKKNKDAHCFSSYDTFNLAPARTANSILISAGVDLNMFNQDKVRNMTTTSYKVQARSIDGKIRSFCRDSDGQLIRDDDNLDIRTIGDRKTCIFINIPQADPTYNFLVSMLYSQMFEALYGRAEKICPRKYMVINKYGDPILSMIDSEEDAVRLIKLYKDAKVKKIKEHGQDMFYITNSSAPKRFWIPGSKGGKLQKVYSEKSGQKYLKEFDDAKIVQGKGKLPWHVQCLLDEFSNIGSIPSFPQKLATMRKYEISCMIVLQSIAQLKNKYDKLYSDILSNCDCTIFLGSSDPETCKYVSDRLGKKTIIVKQHSYSSKGSNTGYNVSDRELLTVEEVSRLDNAKSIVMVNGERPFLATKYKALDHPNWKKTGDVDAKQQLEAADFTTCQEKALSIHGDAYATMNALLNAIGGTDEKGKGVMGQEQTVTSPVDAVNKAGGNVSNIAEAADAVQPVQGNFDMLSMVDMEDDLPPVQPSIPVGSDIPRRGAHDHSGKGSGGNTGKSAASVVSRRSAPEA